LLAPELLDALFLGGIAQLDGVRKAGLPESPNDHSFVLLQFWQTTSLATAPNGC
jgi:hypothetical protein